MQKIATVMGLIVTAVATASHATPQEGTFYAGSKVGWSSYYSTKMDNLPGTTKADNNQLGAGAFFGYQITPHVAIETSYDWLGKMDYKSDDKKRASLQTQGIQLSAKLSWPVLDNLDVYGRIGTMSWRTKTTLEGDSSYSKNGVSPLVAAGLEYAITDSFATRLDYQWVNKISKKDEAQKMYGQPNNGLLTLGFSYRFGQKVREEIKPLVEEEVIVSKKDVTEVISRQEFTLNAEVLFEFGKDTLTEKGQMMLDQMVNQLKAKNTVDGTVIVLGYADRIGSEKYNQILSEKRSETVKAYLMNQGIAEDKITARGMGKTDTFSSGACDRIKARNSLVECLASDRRVEVEVNGVAEVAGTVESEEAYEPDEVNSGSSVEDFLNNQ